MSDHNIIEVKTYIPDNMKETRKTKGNTENAFTALNFYQVDRGVHPKLTTHYWPYHSVSS